MSRLLIVYEDCDVETRGSITEAAERVRDVKFDCVIMDVELPEMKGYDAVPILKTIDPELEIIMTAAENTMELEIEVRKQDVFYYHLKSFDLAELKEAVRNVFKKTGKLKEVKNMDKPAKVLIVDDDPDFVEATRTILKTKGYGVAAAFNKTEALLMIETIKPDLVLLDIMMERCSDGFTICYKLKHDPALRQIPILAISAITERTGFKFSPKTDGEYFQADDYVEKPVKPADLLERVEKLLNM